MRLARPWVPVLGVGVIVLSVAVAMAAGAWVSTGREEIARKTVAKTLAVEDIKGWMTIREVAELYRVDEGELRRAVGIPVSVPASTPLRELEQTVEGFEVDEVRTAVSGLQSGQPVIPAPTQAPAATGVSSKVPPPSTAGRPVQAKGRPAPTPAATTAPGAASAGEHAPAFVTSPEEIRGTMTLNEVSSAFNFPVDQLRDKLGFPAEADPNRPLREFKSEVPGFEVELVREAVRQWLAK